MLKNLLLCQNWVLWNMTQMNESNFKSEQVWTQSFTLPVKDTKKVCCWHWYLILEITKYARNSHSLYSKAQTCLLCSWPLVSSYDIQASHRNTAKATALQISSLTASKSLVYRGKQRTWSPQYHLMCDCTVQWMNIVQFSLIIAKRKQLTSAFRFEIFLLL